MFRPLVFALIFGALTFSARCQEAAAQPPDPAAPVTAPAASEAAAPAEQPSAPDAAAAQPETAAQSEAAPKPRKPASRVSIEIDLQQQRAYLLRDGRKIAESRISSGRAGHLTPTGDFSVTQKDLNHFSNLYGSIVDKNGRTVVAGADASMPVPRGCRFKPAPMKHFLRFEGAAGMHAGLLPGYPASHGCVRMPADKAKLFYEVAELGSPVHVFGKTPTRGGSTDRSSTARLARAEREGRTTPRVNPAPMPTPEPVPARPVKRGWFPFFRR